MTGLSEDEPLSLGASQNSLKTSQSLLKRSGSVLRHSQIPYSELTVEKEIGAGSYGRVCLGRWNHGPVALKFCKKKDSIEDFVREVRVMMYFFLFFSLSFSLFSLSFIVLPLIRLSLSELPPHPNVVQMFGISIDGPEAVIILEYCDGGNINITFLPSLFLSFSFSLVHTLSPNLKIIIFFE
jgi:serine/threonine protein kinase